MHRLTMTIALIACALGVTCAQPFTIESFDDLAAMEGRKALRCENEATYAAADGALTVTLPPRGKVNVSVDPALLADNGAWDACNAVRFRVKGDGSDNYGCIAFGPSWSYYYEVWFPLKDTSWHEVTCPLRELVSMSAVKAMGTPGTPPPSGLANIILGTRWYLVWNNERMPEYSFSIDDIELTTDASIIEPVPEPQALDLVLRHMKRKDPVRVYCMGDSITAGTGLASKYEEQYAAVLQGLLRERLGYDAITVESRAVGGAKLNDARAWAVRDFAGDPPDLVTICYGYNDKSAGQSKDFFKYSLGDYIDRIARLTGGNTAIVPITTLPGGQWRFVMMDDFADGVREVSAERGLECIDMAAEIKPLGRLTWGNDYLGDRAHPNAEGHRWLAEHMAEWFVAKIAELE